MEDEELSVAKLKGKINWRNPTYHSFNYNWSIRLHNLNWTVIHYPLSASYNVFLIISVNVAKATHRKQVESIQLKVNVKIGAIEIGFETDTRPLSIMKLQGAAAGLILKSSYTQVDCTIASIKVEDLNPETLHKEVTASNF